MSTGNRYSKEFKEDAIRLVKEEGRSSISVAKDLGVNPQTLRNWLKEYTDSQDPQKTRIAELEAELREKKKRIADLEMTNDILKKAAAIFVKDNQK
ncbi:transposase [Petroclostridium sp. X23]|uniref:transposase n=1 Tax=Petroclostridium sp. X23 TaxID=3045146 RepID=UPI0024ACCD48|nr:transposase [Petroclostridium sp. X23]WHH56922.1 transposase [Petroclostridium sp. X23]